MCRASACFSPKATSAVAECEFHTDDRDYDNPYNLEVKTAGRPIYPKGRFGGPDRLARVRRQDGRVTNRFPVREGTVLYDGLGESLGLSLGRGTVLGGVVYINYGQRKKMLIHGRYEDVVYVISAPTTLHAKGASGWIKKSDVIGYRRLLTPDKMPDVRHHQQREFTPRPACTISGGDPGLYHNRKVRPCVSDNNIDARDYLKRTPDVTSIFGGYVNLLYNLPGRGSISADTFPIGVTTFVPVANVKPVTIPLYRKHSSRQVSVRHRPNEMTFAFGYVRTPNCDPTLRFGWIARDALSCP